MQRIITLVTALFLFLSLLPASLSAACFTRLELTPVAPPAFCQNAMAYEIRYFSDLDGQPYKVFPTVEERRQDADLILARVVRQVIQDHYENQGHWLDEWWVDPTTTGEINHLVGKDFLNPAWSNDNRRHLMRYLSSKADVTQLHKLSVIMDYQDGKVQHGGTDINPILLHLEPPAGRSDQAIILLVPVSDEYPPPEIGDTTNVL